MIGRTDERENPGWPVVYKYRPSVRMSFAEPIWARGHVAARRGRTHDRFRTATNFAESPLTFAGRPHMGQRSLRRVDKAGHMIAVDLPVSLLIFLLHPRGRSLIAPPLSIDSCLLVLPYRGHGSLRGRKDPPQHLVRSTGAAMSTAGSHCSHAAQGPPRSRLHPRPVGQSSHPRRRSG